MSTDETAAAGDQTTTGGIYTRREWAGILVLASLLILMRVSGDPQFFYAENTSELIGIIGGTLVGSVVMAILFYVIGQKIVQLLRRGVRRVRGLISSQ